MLLLQSFVTNIYKFTTQAESETQQKEDDDEYLDINTLKGDPNDGDDE